MLLTNCLLALGISIALASEHHEDPHHDDEHASESAASGFALSKEALRNFEIKTQKLVGPPPWTVPAAARLFSIEEVNLYRLRDGKFSRVDFKTSKNAGLNESRLSLSSADLRAGDEIVTAGVGFLRIAEIAAFGGAPEGHSH